jgi:5-methylcytosine-specific restriction enzyme subunit McrC
VARVIQLREYHTSRVSDLTIAQAAAIAEVLRHADVSPTRENGVFEIRPHAIVGAATVGDLEIHVLPKVQLPNLLFMVSYAVDPRGWRDDLASFQAVDSVVEAIIPAFVRMVHAAVGRGMLHGYREEQDSLLSVRGRIHMGEQVRRRHGVLVPVEVGYDDYTVDIVENRLLKAGLFALSRMRLRSPAVARMLHHALGMFDQVELVQWRRRHLPHLHYTRLNEHYRPALELARLILDGVALDAGSGNCRANAFMLDMNKVFEAFVYRGLVEALGVSENVFQRCHKGLTLDTGNQIGLEPDLSWWEDGQCRFVGDVKYKQLDEESFKQPDMYQMLAYMSATGLEHATLLYAGTASEHRQFTMRQLGRVIEVRTLNVSRSPAVILSELKTVASAVANRVREQVGFRCHGNALR